MNKPVYLGLLILDLSKTAIFGFWYNYVKRKYDEKAKLYYMHTNSFIVHVKADVFIKTLDKMLKQDITPRIIN